MDTKDDNRNLSANDVAESRRHSTEAFEETFIDVADIKDVSEFEMPEKGRSVSLVREFGRLVVRISKRKRFIFGIVLLAIGATLFAVSTRASLFETNTLIAFFRTHETLSPFLFVAVYALMVVFLMPTMPLNLGAGFLWGTYLGTAYSVLGAVIGAATAFYVSRYIAHDYLWAKFRNTKAWDWVHAELSDGGWRVVAFTRVNPAFPFGPTNYLFGLAPIAFRYYIIATIIFTIPPSLVVASLGASIGGFVLAGTTSALFRDAALAGAAITVLIVVRRIFARKGPAKRPTSND